MGGAIVDREGGIWLFGVEGVEYLEGGQEGCPARSQNLIEKIRLVDTWSLSSGSFWSWPGLPLNYLFQLVRYLAPYS